ncbi:50S ribosomal protein L6 [Desulfonatronum lacustre]|uniref:50S ribosomal protein L6 n=1 Tax=Desulfonatronum lacustre TaxID=66849 RepID=UPI00048CFF21|nr:50S ribosomal protein L6 [Desulfonatronum lacustre]SMP46827.1 LSU ribosomal protein L6P [Desulfonatronum zhilinae]
MSRIGKNPVPVPKGVEVRVHKDVIEIKGPKGELKTPTHAKISYELKDDAVHLSRVDDSRSAREQFGLRRTLLANSVQGVTEGFQKILEVIGVGYKVAVDGSKITLNVGFSHPVEYSLPQGMSAKVEGNKLTLQGIDKEQVGEVAAQIRRFRPPEPFKGKGIKYADEVIRRKAGKTGKK